MITINKILLSSLIAVVVVHPGLTRQTIHLDSDCNILLAQPNQQGELTNFHCHTPSAEASVNPYPFLPEIFYGGMGTDIPSLLLINPQKIWLWRQAIERQRQREERNKERKCTTAEHQSIVEETPDEVLYSLLGRG